MIPVSQYLIQSCIEELELALENQVDRHCDVYICDGYGYHVEEWEKQKYLNRLRRQQKKQKRDIEGLS